MPWRPRTHVAYGAGPLVWMASKVTLGVGSVLLAVNEIVNFSRENVIGWMGLIALGAGGLLRGYRLWRDERRVQQVKDDEAFKPTTRKQLAESKAEARKLKMERDELRAEKAEWERDRERLYGRINRLLGLKSDSGDLE